MDRLNTELYGGFPWELDDWRWELNAHREALAGLCKGLQAVDAGVLIISGLEPTLNPGGGVVAISSGWLTWAGELYFFPGGPGNGSIGPDLHFFQKDIGYDTATAEVFEDGTTQNAYEKRRLKLVATGIDYSMTHDAELFAPLGRVTRIRDLLWRSPQEDIIDFYSDMSAPTGMKVRFDPGGIVRLNGEVHYDGFATGAIGIRGMFILPEKYRPATSVIRSVGMFPFTDTPRIIQIATNGNVSVFLNQTGIGPGTKLFLQDVRFNLH